MLSKSALLALLHRLEIAFHICKHQAVMTVDESKNLKKPMNGVLCKCLFLQSADGALWLAAVPGEMRVDLKLLAQALACKRLSFGAPDLMEKHLGVSPGAATLFATANDTAHAVHTVIEESLWFSERPLAFHPLLNTATISIMPRDLMRFLDHTGHTPVIVRAISQ